MLGTNLVGSSIEEPDLPASTVHPELAALIIGIGTIIPSTVQVVLTAESRYLSHLTPSKWVALTSISQALGESN
jgi:hypothetical protein